MGPDTRGTSYDRNVVALQAEFPSATGEWNVGSDSGGYWITTDDWG